MYNIMYKVIFFVNLILSIYLFYLQFYYFFCCKSNFSSENGKILVYIKEGEVTGLIYFGKYNIINLNILLYVLLIFKIFAVKKVFNYRVSVKV